MAGNELAPEGLKTNYEPRRIVKAECNENGVFCYLNSDDKTHEIYGSNTMMSFLLKTRR